MARQTELSGRAGISGKALQIALAAFALCGLVRHRPGGNQRRPRCLIAPGVTLAIAPFTETSSETSMLEPASVGISEETTTFCYPEPGTCGGRSPAGPPISWRNSMPFTHFGNQTGAPSSRYGGPCGGSASRTIALVNQAWLDRFVDLPIQRHRSSRRRFRC
jgi:hypothetical protein